MPIKTQRSIRFIIPGLIDPVPYLDQLPVADLPSLPVFSKMLSRGQSFIPDILNDDPNNFYHCLSDTITPELQTTSIASLGYYFDIKCLSESERKLCNVSLESLADDVQQGKWIMRADPCFLAADRDQLVLAQSDSLGLTLSEAQSLADEINHFFKDYKEENFWTLKIASAEHWYIVSDKSINIQSIPTENVIGQPIRDYLFSNKKFIEQGRSDKKDASHWLGLFNEFQMILHQSQINKKRQVDKKIPINSLWFWGAGKLNNYTQTSYHEASVKNEIVYSQNSLAQNLAELNHLKHIHLADNFLLDTALSDTNYKQTTYVIDDFIRAIRNKDIFTWVGLLEQFETNYLKSLSNDLKLGKITTIEFISPTGRQLVINKRALNRWWKKVKYYFEVL
jgi:hypothetical protein